MIRRTLEPDLPARSPSSYLTSSDHGYRLHAETDAAAFAATVHRVHAAAGPLVTAAAPVAADPAAVQAQLTALEEALARWRGTPYADLPDGDAVVPERARLAELRVLALEDRATLLVATGRDGAAISELEALIAEHPLRERLWTLLAVALARSGRQADALATLERLRIALDEELGLEPSAAVREVQTAILRQEVGGPAAASGGPASPPIQLPVPVRIRLPDWPLVGRETHLQTLSALLARAEAGEPRFASIVGEAGAGKTRLGCELAVMAEERGALLLVGRCTQEEDAPPLWPWTSALGPLLDTSDVDGDHDAARFAVAERVRQVLADLSTDRLVLLGLEDLHWADPSSLRVLRHLATHVDRGRLLVVATWRRSEQTGPLAEVAEALARRHATRVEVGGLSADETSELLAKLTGDTDPEVASAVHQRTDGNPFFLIEYGRLARDESRSLDDVVSGTPATVVEVLDRRMARLPEDTRRALQAGAAIGREFDVALLASAIGEDELGVLDLLEPALAAELAIDLGDDRFRFAHALVRDAAYDSLSPSRRQRLHARLAELVEADPVADRRATEVARHWAAAGPRHVGRAWRAASRAGDLALEAHAADEAAQQYDAALALQAADPEGTTRERVDLLVAYAEACRWSTRRLEMHQAIDEAVVLAGQLGDPDLVVRAATVGTRDALWPARSYGHANHEVISVLRSALTVLPRDSAVRCRMLLAIASEAYYAAPSEEIDALCEEAITTARRLEDAPLLVEALTAAAVSTFRWSTASKRRLWIEEGLVLAARLGDERARTNLRALYAPVLCEMGEVPGVREELADIIRVAREHKLYFGEMVALTLLHAWEAMRGDEEAIARTFQRLIECFDLVSMAHKVDIVQGAALFVPLWNPDAPAPEAADVMAYLESSDIPVGPAAAVLALRKGRPDAARTMLDAYGIELDIDNWYSSFHWALGAEIGLGLHEPDIAAAAYAKLAPYRGCCVMSGTAPAHGPTDAYLALAAAAAGQRDLAAEHGEAALRLIDEWDVPNVRRWFLGLREQHGF